MRRRACPGALRDDGVRENADRRAGAARGVIGLAGSHRVAEFLGENIGEVCSIDGPCQRGRLVGKVAISIGHRWDRDQAGIHALYLARALVVQKEERFVAFDRPSKSAAELVLNESSNLGRVEITRIEIGIAQKIEGATVKLVRAGLRDHVDLAATEV